VFNGGRRWATTLCSLGRGGVAARTSLASRVGKEFVCYVALTQETACLKGTAISVKASLACRRA
jgi:hypothetical protein